MAETCINLKKDFCIWVIALCIVPFAIACSSRLQPNVNSTASTQNGSANPPTTPNPIPTPTNSPSPSQVTPATPSCGSDHPCIYVSQISTGTGNGTSCADSLPVAWFNSPSNWGSGAGLIGPGTVVHLCGTFVGSPGATMLTAQGSGTVAKPIYILFEPNASMTAPYWNGQIPGGAINISNQHDLMVDGGSNGLITASDNGTEKSFHQVSRALTAQNCSNCEVRNLKITNMYVRKSGSADDCDCGYAIYASGSSVRILNNQISHANSGIVYGFGGDSQTSNSKISGNKLDNICGGIKYVDSGGIAGTQDDEISENELSNPNPMPWQGDLGGGDHFHCDGMHFWNYTSSQVKNLKVFSNYWHGFWSNNTTGYLFVEGAISQVSIYNNVMSLDPGSNLSDGFFAIRAGSAFKIMNNTIRGNGNSIAVNLESGSNHEVVNNIFESVGYGLMCASDACGIYNFNIYANIANGWALNGGTIFNSFATWKSSTGQDSQSSIGLAILASNFQPSFATFTSPPAGENLTNLGLITLNQDFLKQARPNSGPWTPGAIQLAH